MYGLAMIKREGYIPYIYNRKADTIYLADGWYKQSDLKKLIKSLAGHKGNYNELSNPSN